MQQQFHKLADALLEAHRSTRTGVVRFESDRERKQLALKAGKVAFAESNLPDEHLARILTQMGKLQKPDVGKIAAEMRKGKASDQAVREATQLGSSEIEEGLREQAVIIAASLMQHEGDPFRLYPVEGALHRSCDLQMPVPQLLVLAARWAVTRRLVPARYRALEGTLHPSLLDGQVHVDFPLSGAESYVLAELREPISFQSLSARLPPLGTPTEELVQTLLLLGLITLGDTAAQNSDKSPHAVHDSLEQRVHGMIARCKKANHYEVLSLAPNASDEKIRLAYHDLARQFHPDRFQSSDWGPDLRQSVELLFTYITGAYAVLGDPNARAKYDKELKERERGSSDGGTHAGSDQEKSRMADTLSRAGNAALARHEYEKAAALFRECLWLQPEVAKRHYALGVAQTEIPRQRKEAEQNLLTAVRLEPTLLAAQLALARLYLKVNLPRRAEARLLELLRWDPQHREAKELLEQVAARL